MIRLLCLSLLLLPSFAYTQAWLRQPNGGFVQTSFSSISTNRIYNGGNKEVQLHHTVNDLTFQQYGEYGVYQKLTIATSLPIKYVNTINDVYIGYLPDTLDAGSLSHTGNISISAIYGIKQQGNWVSSFKLKTDLNTAHYREEYGLRSGYNAWGIMPTICFGKSISSYFFTSETGINIRTNHYSTQLIQQLQIGRNIAEKVWVILAFDYLKSLKNGNFDDGTSVHTGLYMSNIEWTAFLLKTGYQLNPQWTLWGTFGGGISGYAVQRAPSLALALSYEWKSNKE